MRYFSDIETKITGRTRDDVDDEKSVLGPFLAAIGTRKPMKLTRDQCLQCLNEWFDADLRVRMKSFTEDVFAKLLGHSDTRKYLNEPLRPPPNPQTTILSRAVWSSNERILKCLCRCYSVDLNARLTDDRKTALMIAVELEAAPCVEELLSIVSGNRIDWEAMDAAGRTAFERSRDLNPTHGRSRTIIGMFDAVREWWCWDRWRFQYHAREALSSLNVLPNVLSSIVVDYLSVAQNPTVAAAIAAPLP